MYSFGTIIIMTLYCLGQAIVQYHQWSTMSAREVNQLQKDLAELENGLTISDSTQQLRTELTNLRNKVCIYLAVIFKEMHYITVLIVKLAIKRKDVS